MTPKSEPIIFAGIEVHFCLDENDTNGQLTMFKCVIHPGSKVPAPHYHEHFDESVYSLKGTVTYTVDGKSIELVPGESLFIPRGVVHGFANKTNEVIEFLCTCSPGVFRPSYFRELAAVINAGGPPDMSKIKAIMQEHGLVPVAG